MERYMTARASSLVTWILSSSPLCATLALIDSAADADKSLAVTDVTKGIS